MIGFLFSLGFIGIILFILSHQCSFEGVESDIEQYRMLHFGSSGELRLIIKIAVKAVHK